MCVVKGHPTSCCCPKNKEKPFDPTKPVQTRDGRKARVICTDRKGQYPIVALFELYKGGDETTGHYDINGQIYGQRSNSISDLVNVPVIRHEYQRLSKKKDDLVLYWRYDKPLSSPQFPENYWGQLKYTFEDDNLISVELLKEYR